MHVASRRCTIRCAAGWLIMGRDVSMHSSFVTPLMSVVKSGLISYGCKRVWRLQRVKNHFFSSLQQIKVTYSFRGQY